MNCIFILQVIIKDKVLELLLYFTKHEDEEVKTKAIIGLGKHIFFFYIVLILISIYFMGYGCAMCLEGVGLVVTEPLIIRPKRLFLL